jgi:hypothetical protein
MLSLTPKVPFGRRLMGDPVYYIYADEAGTSRKEPVTVVVGVILNADRHWRRAAEYLDQVLNVHVPADLRAGFIFHAKTVWSGYREHNATWPRGERAALIKAVAATPRTHGMAIALGRVRRDWKFPIEPAMRLHDFQHIMAFKNCIDRANKYIRDWADPEEVATLVAEDVPEKRRFLKAVLKVNVSLPLEESYILATTAEKKTGHILQTNAGPIDKIVDTVHFAQKDEAPLLQIADACAFSFRRYFAEQEYGNDLVEEMLGGPLIWEDWQGPMSQMTFSFNPAHRYPRAA